MFLKKIGLSSADEAKLKAALITFAANHSTWERQVALNGGASPEMIAQGWAIVQSTFDVLSQQLTTDGNTRLIQYVMSAKAHMKVQL